MWKNLGPHICGHVNPIPRSSTDCGGQQSITSPAFLLQSMDATCLAWRIAADQLCTGSQPQAQGMFNLCCWLAIILAIWKLQTKFEFEGALCVTVLLKIFGSWKSVSKLIFELETCWQWNMAITTERMYKTWHNGINCMCLQEKRPHSTSQWDQH